MPPATDNLFQRHPIVSYSIARLALFLVALALLRLAGLQGLALIGLAVLISGGVALILLDGIRGRYGSTVAGYFRRLNERIDAATRAEDLEDDVYRTQALDAASSPGESAPAADEPSVIVTPGTAAAPDSVSDSGTR